MLLIAELKQIAQARLADAEALLMAERLDGAAYLCGYVVELSLKQKICKTLNWEGFPENNREFEGLASFKVHDLDKLLHLSGAEALIKEDFLRQWSIVKTWSPESRYNRVIESDDLSQKQTQVVAIIGATKTLVEVL